MGGQEEVRSRLEAGVLTVTIDRGAKRNAMTAAMYAELSAQLDRAADDPEVRAFVLRSAAPGIFVAGTDISHFAGFTGADGVDYEAMISGCVRRLETLRVPTVAVVEGVCLGGGLVLASVCDLRIATPAARFGVPVARTLGNCLSADSLSVLTHRLGSSVTLDLLLRARTLDAEEAHRLGFVAEVAAEDAVEETLGEVLQTLRAHAPLTMWATKELVARLRRAAVPQDADVLRAVYGSADFGTAVEAFASRTPVTWTGR